MNLEGGKRIRGVRKEKDRQNYAKRSCSYLSGISRWLILLPKCFKSIFETSKEVWCSHSKHLY